LWCGALAVFLAAGGWLAQASGTPVNLTAFGVAATQNFDTLASAGASSALPAGWALSETGANANAEYTAGAGGLTMGDTYSFGATGSGERAFGALQSASLVPSVGACFSNQTGGTITSLAVAYTGEQWRLGATGRVDRLDFQYSADATSLTTGTWQDVNELDFTAPVTAGAVGALNGNTAPNRAAVAFTVNGLSIANGATFFIRWTDFNAAGSDDGLAIDDFSLTPNGTNTPTLAINDVAVAEGDSGATVATFTVALSAPAPAPVSFDIATQDGTATVADNDYQPRSLAAQTIPQGATMYQFAVSVMGDTRTEPDETFAVVVGNATGATVADGAGLGAITNDDTAPVPIHDLQGAGSASPFAGSSVTARGVVTGVRSNGFFIQAPDNEIDANPNTSEGVSVFTGSPVPAGAVLGNLVSVSGQVIEFRPSGDPGSPSITEFNNSPAVSVISTGHALPAPVTLTAADTDPSGGLEALEKYEGMRVRVASLTVIAPTEGSVNETSATGSSNGVFYGIIVGLPRPFREPGLAAPDAPPPGSPPNIPVFDANPERLRVDSDGQTGGTRLTLTAGVTVSNIVGPLDYGARTYTILPDAATPPTATANGAFQPAPTPEADEFTVASANLQRFYDDVDDPGGDTVLTATAFQNRLRKASLMIRNALRLPDIIGVEEIENLSALNALAARVNADTIAAGQPNPNYTAFLQEGNDVGLIDVGFLVKTARVSVLDVAQVGRDATYVEPGGGTALLNDRPPLVLRANVQAACGGAFPVTVIVNHLRSLLDINDPTDGPRVRAKRRAQAEFLANLIQTRQTTDPAERLLAVGDFNSFEFNDGYVDVIGAVKGTPAPATQAVLGAGDLVMPDAANLVEEVASGERYSYVFGGNAQVLDHALATRSLQPFFSRLHYARVNADFPETFRSDATRPERISDHDPLLAYFKFTAVNARNLSVYNGGETVTLDVNAPPGCAWTAASDAPWLAFTSGASGHGSGAATLRADYNPTFVTRAATLTVAGRTVNVTQTGTDDGCTYRLETSFLKDVPATGGGGTINVASNCQWAAVSNASWLRITSGASGTGSGVVTFTVAPNTNAGRGGTITVGGRNFVVKQNPR
jgi:hypothetical protein